MLHAHAVSSSASTGVQGQSSIDAAAMAAARRQDGDTKGRVKSCIFCRLSQHSSTENSDYLHEHQEYLFVNDDLFVVPDIKPSATHHFLVIPHEHIKNPKVLTRKHIPLIKSMQKAAMVVLKEKNQGKEVTGDYRIGFHWPPLIMIKHLHMHVFYPISSMSAFNRQLLFKPGLLFVTPEWLIERLEKINDE
jgi:diadenosine tetraphosphate (Ap4A) HIT family hydrolase